VIFCFNIQTSGCSNPQKVVGHPRDSLYSCRPRPFTGSTSIGGPKELLPGDSCEFGREWAFQFFTNTDGGLGGCQSGGAGSFPRTKREVFGGTKIQVFEFGVEYLNFGATYLSFGAIYLNCVTIYLNSGSIYLNSDAKGVWGGVGRSPRTSGRFRHRYREKIFRTPLGIRCVPISLFLAPLAEVNI